MRTFKWIEWNVQHIAAHGLSPEEVEAAFDKVFTTTERADGSHRRYAETHSVKRIWIVWRYDCEEELIPYVFGDLPDPPIFLITAY